MGLLQLLLFLIIGKEVGSAKSGHTDLNKAKRQVNGLPLVFPYGAIYKLQIGMTQPLKELDEVNLNFFGNFQYQYEQFSNISQLSQYYFVKEVTREQRQADIKQRKDERLMFYQSIASLLDSNGMNGMECVLRAICEAAQDPIEDQGLVGEIIHILLTPDYGKTPFDEENPDTDWRDSMSEFLDAATAGRQMFSCTSIFSDCAEGQGVLEMMSVLRNK